VSPDGRRLAYVSSGDEQPQIEQLQLSVRDLVGTPRTWLVYSGGATEPVWSRNGRELFFRHGDQLLRVDVPIAAGTPPGAAHMLFSGAFLSNAQTAEYDVFPDGSGFVMVLPPHEPAAPIETVLVLDWSAELRRATAREGAAR
jgi:Tol biopolymer transport system component